MIRAPGACAGVSVASGPPRRTHPGRFAKKVQQARGDRIVQVRERSLAPWRNAPWQRPRRQGLGLPSPSLMPLPHKIRDRALKVSPSPKKISRPAWVDLGKLSPPPSVIVDERTGSATSGGPRGLRVGATERIPSIHSLEEGGRSMEREVSKKERPGNRMKDAFQMALHHRGNTDSGVASDHFRCSLVFEAAGRLPPTSRRRLTIFGPSSATTTAWAVPSAGGRREINWDGVADGFAAPNNLPANFFNKNSPRGVVFAARVRLWVSAKEESRRSVRQSSSGRVAQVRRLQSPAAVHGAQSPITEILSSSPALPCRDQQGFGAMSPTSTGTTRRRSSTSTSTARSCSAASCRPSGQPDPLVPGGRLRRRRRSLPRSDQQR